MEFRVLGSVEAYANGAPLTLGPPQQRLVLAVLAAEAGRVVTPETLVLRVWDEPPAGARRSLHVYITRIRRLLEQAKTPDSARARLLRRSGGYVLDVDPGRVDVHRFRRLVDRAAEPSSTDRAALLREAVGLWRGEPLSAMPGGWAARTRQAWQQEHLHAMAAWARAETLAGASSMVIGPLSELVNENPLVEPLAAELIRALHASGRTGEALACYQKTRKRLVEELGVDPGHELQAIHQAVLRGEPAQQDTDSGSVPVVPAQLPADVPGFVGRDKHLTQLDTLLSSAHPHPNALAIFALCGTAGVGKSALAIHWAHRIRDRFPDGQLYVNLRGFDPGGAVMHPREAVRGFLDALRVPPQRIPADLAAQAGLYRSLLARQRMLIVLDNARDSEQVRPLLPGAPGCLVLVASRTLLSSLVAVEGAHPVMVDLLTTDESRQLLARRAGAERAAAERRAVEEIIACCARLPLALVITAARATTHPTFPLATLANELRDSNSALTGEDPATDVQAVFSWSYRTMTPGAARLFRLLGLHPGPDISGPAAASLTGQSLAQTRPQLAELTRAHLIAEHVPGRYTFHDLLRAYASDLAHRHESEAERRAASHRIMDHFLHTAYTAARLHDPRRDPITLPPAQSGVTPEDLTDYDQALDWFTAERRVLLATITRAAATGFDTHAWQLAWSLTTFLDGQGHWHDLMTIQTSALHAARRLADRHAQTHAHHAIALASTRLGGSLDNAKDHLLRALELARSLDDHAGQAHALLSLAYVREREGRFRDALAHSEQALDLYQAAGHRNGHPTALNHIGWYHALLDNHPAAITYSRRALNLYRQLNDLRGQAEAWHSLGYAHHHSGDRPMAVTCYEHALTIFEHLDDQYAQALAATRLGDARLAGGNPDAARAMWQRALAMLEQLSPSEANAVRARLDAQ